MPVASEDEFFDEDITIEDTDLEDFDDWEAPSGGMVKGQKVSNLLP